MCVYILQVIKSITKMMVVLVCCFCFMSNMDRTSLCQGKLESPDGSWATTTSSQGRDKDSARKAHLRGAGQSVSPVHRKSELKQDKADPSSSPRRLTPTMLQ